MQRKFQVTVETVVSVSVIAMIEVEAPSPQEAAAAALDQAVREAEDLDWQYHVTLSDVCAQVCGGNAEIVVDLVQSEGGTTWKVGQNGRLLEVDPFFYRDDCVGSA